MFKKIALTLIALVLTASMAFATPPYYVDKSGNIHGLSATMSGLTASLPVVTDANKKLVSISAADFLTLVGALSGPSGAGIPNWNGTTWGTSYTLATTVSNPGSAIKIPTEAAVRSMMSAGFLTPFIDWNALGGGASILNKPTLLAYGQTAGTAWQIPVSPGANTLWGWDETDLSVKPVAIGANLTYTRSAGPPVTYTLAAVASSGMSNPMTTTGDMIYSVNGSGTPGRLGMAALDNRPLLSGGTNFPPVWANFGLIGTTGQNYTFPTTSKTLLANDGSNFAMTSQAAGDMFYATGASGLTRLAKGTDSYVLTMSASTHLPVWAANTTAAAGSDTQIQFNDGGTTLAGTSDLYWHKISESNPPYLRLGVSTPDITPPTWGGFPKLIVKSGTGASAIAGWSQTSDGADGRMGTMGVTGYALANSASTAYAGYFEGQRTNSGGIAQGVEAAVINSSTTVDITPDSMVPSGLTSSFWASTGKGGQTSNPVSTGLGFVSVNGGKYRKGIVFDSTVLSDLGGGDYRAIEMGDNYKIAWNDGTNLAFLTFDGTHIYACKNASCKQLDP